MVRWPPLCASLAVALSVALVACGERPPDIVLIALDRTRPDQLGIYGSEATRTPNFDRFARGSVLYDRAYATSSSSLPSHASLLTGLHPMQHGARARLVVGSELPRSLLLPLSDRFTTLAEHLLAAGYRTAAFVANPELRGDLGVAQGFELYDDTLGQSSASSPGQRAKLLVDRAIERVRSYGARPFFLYVDFFEPQLRGAAAIETIDRQLGRLLAALEASPGAEKMLISITSDHGGSSDERPALAGVAHLYEEAVRVPLAIRYPSGAESGSRIDTPTQNHRLFATFLEAAGIPLPEAIKLQPLGGRDTLIFTEARSTLSAEGRNGEGSRDLRALYMFPFKLIQSSSGISEVYDLVKDPNETRSIVSEAPKAYSRLLKLLVQYAALHPPLFDTEHDTNVWPASVARLEALGTVE